MNSNKSLDSDIQDFINIKGEPSCFLLVGQYGSGKTSSLKHYINLHFTKMNRYNSGIIPIYIDLEKYVYQLGNISQNIIELIMNLLLKELLDYLDFIKKEINFFYQDIFFNDDLFIKSRLEGNKNISGIVRKYFANEKKHQHYIIAILNFFVRQFGKWNVILMIDNVDAAKISIQKDIVTTASVLSTQCIKVIIPIRKATANTIKYKNPELFGTFVQTIISRPQISHIIKKRADKALENNLLKNATLSEGHLVFKVKDCVEFSETISKAFSLPSVDRLLYHLSNDSVQEALRLAVKVYASNYIDAKRIIRKLSPTEAIVPTLWHGHLPYYIVLKALMLPDRPVYFPEDSLVANVFGTHHYHHHFGPFMRVYILQYFIQNQLQKIKYTDILNDLSKILITKEAIIIEELIWLLKKDWIEEINTNVFSITTLGVYIIQELIYDMEYLTHIAVDVEMPREMVGSMLLPADSPKERSNNLLLLLKYLVQKELNALIYYSSENDISDYINLFGNEGITNKIIRNIKRTLNDIKSGHVNNDIVEVIDITNQKLHEFSNTLDKINSKLNM